MDSSDVTQLTYKSHLESQTSMRVSNQEKLFHYYIGDSNEILEYLKKVQLIAFDYDDILEMQKMFLNITKKIINQLAIVYKEPAKRTLIEDETTPEQTKLLTDNYNALLQANINTLDKMAHRYAKLFNTSLTRVQFENGKINYDIKSSHLFDVKVSDDSPYKMIELSYLRYYKNEKLEDELYRVYWTDEEHYKAKVADIGNVKNVPIAKEPIGNNTKMLNPYGIIPYAVLRLEMQGDFWGCGTTDVTNTNEQINFLISDLINGIIMQAYGTMVFADTGITDRLKKDNLKVRTGQKHPITFESKQGQGTNQGTVYNVNGNPLIAEVMNVIDWMVKLIALTKGLNPNSFLANVQATSGYSKIIDALEQLEIRQDDIEPCRQYEDDRFNITRKVLNYHIQQKEIEADEISEDVFMQVMFADITIPKTTEEQIKQDEYEIQNNLINVYDIARRKYPDLEDSEIDEKIKANKLINDSFKVEVVKPEVKPIENNTNP